MLTSKLVVWAYAWVMCNQGTSATFGRSSDARLGATLALDALWEMTAPPGVFTIGIGDLLWTVAYQLQQKEGVARDGAVLLQRLCATT